MTPYPATNWNSYISLEAADAYHTARENTAWDGDSRNAALVRATDYIAATYSFNSDPLGDEVHPALIAATAALALHMLTASPNTVSTAPVLEEEVQAGEVKTKTKFGSISNDPYPFVTRLLSPITGSTSGLRIIRIIR